MTKKSAQLVFVLAPGISHLVPTVELAKHLINRDDNISIALMVIKRPFDTKIGAYIDSLASSLNSERIRVTVLSFCPTPNTSESVGSLLNDIIESHKPYVKEAVHDLAQSNSLAAFVVDVFCTPMIDIANHFGVPTLVFHTSGAAPFGLLLHLHALRERDNHHAVELDDADTKLAIPSFANPVPCKVMPNIVLLKEWDSYFRNFMTSIKKADGIILNSYEELESHAIHSFSEGALPVYPVGPILNLNGGGGDKQGSEREAEIIKWLDDQPPSSVVFLCFGSMGWLGEDQVTEIARALENTKARFLWSLQKPPPKGSMGVPSDYSFPELAEVLPQGFLYRTRIVGRVVGWAPQAKVLAHQATGGFVSHCGWNSVLESIHFGVPIATWPLGSEQQMIAFLLVRELKIAVEISLDYRMDFGGESNTILSAETIEKGIRDLMEEDGEIRRRVKEMSKKSKQTLEDGGCSYSHLGRLINYIME